MPGRRPIRVLICDDSAVMRSLLRLVLRSEPQIELAGAAADGPTALSMVDSLRPDLLLLDIEMPGMDGLAVLQQMNVKRRRLPVIMCSTLTRRGASITLDALAAGASDYVTKPSNQNGPLEAAAALGAQLIPKILALCARAVEQPRPALPLAGAPLRGGFSGMLAGGAQPAAIRHPGISAEASTSPAPRILVIGVSTGGPAALEVLLPALPAGFPLPVLIVQHMPALFTALLAERLNQRCALQVREAVPGARVEPGVVHIAKGDWHMELAGGRPTADAGEPAHIRMSQGQPEHHCRPSVDVLFRSVAMHGAPALAVVLTGMGSDGLEGCRAIRAAGGAVLVQDRETSAVWGMPGVVAQAGLAHRVLPLGGLAQEIQRLAAAPRREHSTASDDPQAAGERAAL